MHRWQTTSGIVSFFRLKTRFMLTGILSRFAKIIYMNQRAGSLHVQWFEHSSRTFLKEISDPQELFLCNLCGDIDLKNIHVLGKVTIHCRPPPDRILGPLEFFYK